jgi:rhomboid-related protein 1/2/3
VQLGIFIYYVFDLKNCGIAVNARAGVPMYSPLIYNPCKRYEAWRFLTYMFIHQG